MANIYEPTQAAPLSNYLQYSREPDRVRPDTFLGDLFKGIGNVFEGAVQGVDELFKINIMEEAGSKLRANRDANIEGNIDLLGTLQDASKTPLEGRTEGFQERGVLVPDSSKNVPAALSEALKANSRVLSKSRAMRNAGKMSPIHYDMQSEAILSDLRSRYPGYVDYIDQVGSRILGHNPANSALAKLQSLINDNLAKQSAEDDKLTTYENQNASYIEKVAPGYFLNREKNRAFLPQIQNEIAQIKARELEIKLDKEEVDYALRNGQPIDAPTRITNSFSREVGQTVSAHINRLVRQAGFNTVEDLTKRLGESRDYSPQEVANLQALASSLRASITEEVMRLANTPLREGSDRTVVTMIGAEKVKQIADNQLFAVKALEDAILDKQKGVAGLLVQREKFKTDLLKARMDEAFPLLRTLEIIREKTGGGAPLEIILRSSLLGRRLNNIASQLVGVSLADISSGRNPDATVTNTIAKYRELGETSPSANASLINGMHTALINPQIPNFMKINTANALYRDVELFGNIKDSEKLEFLQRFASPAITKEMKRLGDEAPRVWEDYKFWVTKATRTTFSQAGADLAQEQKDGWLSEKSPLQLVFDPTTNQVVIERGETPGFTPGAIQRLDTVEAVMKKKIEPINQALKLVGDVYKTDKSDIAPELIGTLALLGIKAPTQEGVNAGTPTDISGARKQGTLSFQEVEASDNPISNIVNKAESGKASYNAVVGGRTANLTGMTIGQVYEFQNNLKASGSESTAVGKFQTVSATLKRAVKALGFDENTPFNEATQDAIGEYLIAKEAGGDAYLAGDISKKRFADKLARVWAGLPLKSGKSAYEGVGSNRTTVSRAEVLKAIDKWAQEKSIAGERYQIDDLIPPERSTATEFSSVDARRNPFTQDGKPSGLPAGEGGGGLGVSSSGSPIVGYRIVDKNTGRVVGNYKGNSPSIRKRVRNKIDKLDNEYGGYNYRMERVYEDGSTTVAY